MPVAVIDVGSNTVRLVAARGDREIVSRREMLRLGASVEQFGSIPADKLAETAEVVRRFADAARAADAHLVSGSRSVVAHARSSASQARTWTPRASRMCSRSSRRRRP